MENGFRPRREAPEHTLPAVDPLASGIATLLRSGFAEGESGAAAEILDGLETLARRTGLPDWDGRAAALARTRDRILYHAVRHQPGVDAADPEQQRVSPERPVVTRRLRSLSRR